MIECIISQQPSVPMFKDARIFITYNYSKGFDLFYTTPKDPENVKIFNTIKVVADPVI